MTDQDKMSEPTKAQIDKRFKSLCALPESDTEKLRTAAESIEYWNLQYRNLRDACCRRAPVLSEEEKSIMAWKGFHSTRDAEKLKDLVLRLLGEKK